MLLYLYILQSNVSSTNKIKQSLANTEESKQIEYLTFESKALSCDIIKNFRVYCNMINVNVGEWWLRGGNSRTYTHFL